MATEAFGKEAFEEIGGHFNSQIEVERREIAASTGKVKLVLCRKVRSVAGELDGKFETGEAGDFCEVLGIIERLIMECLIRRALKGREVTYPFAINEREIERQFS